MKKAKGPAVPQERKGTIRQEIITLLEEGQLLTAKDVSAVVRIPEKEVYEHLEHIQKSLSKTGQHLNVKPAECLKCGFVFSKRDRLKTPGRCPVCHAEHIQEPLFRLSLQLKDNSQAVAETLFATTVLTLLVRVKLISIVDLSLGVVHGPVCFFQEDVRTISVLRIQTYPYACAYGEDFCGDAEGS